MFKKITAVIAATTLIVVGLVSTPASATPTSNAGAVSKTSWSLSYSSPAGAVSSTTSTTNIPAGANNVNSYLQIKFPNSYVQTLAGHQIVVDWHETFPTGVTWNTGAYDPAKPYKYVRGDGGGGYNPTWGDVNVVENNTTAGEPANSSVFTVPNSVTQINQDYQYFSVTLGFTQSYNAIRAGAYTIAPTLYDRTAQAPITLATTESTSAAYVTSVWNWIDGIGEYAGTVPANSSLDQRLTTCVLANRLTLGNVLTLDRIKGGVSIGASQWGDSFQIKGTSNYGGSFSPNWTVTDSVTTNNWSGIRVSSVISADNTAGSSAMTLPAFDLIVRDTTAGNAQLESTCAAQTPAKPTFTLTSTTSGRITWAKNSDDTNVQYWNGNTSYYWTLYKASDLATPIMVREFENPTLTNGTYTEDVYFRDSNWMAIPVDLDTNYVVKIVAENQGDYTPSAASPASDPSALATPAAPTGVTLDVMTPTKFKITWNKIASDVARTGCGNPNCGRTADYTYELFKASDLNTVVASAGLWQAVLTGDTYSVTLQDVMSGPPYWTTVRLDANTDYVVKIRAYDSVSNLQSAWSTASPVDSLVGPPAPLKPTEPLATVSSVTAKLTMRAGETANSYKLVVYLASDLTTPLTTSLNSSSACTPTAVGALTLNCSVSINSGLATFTAPNMYVVKAFAANSDGLISVGSPASNEFMGGVPGVIVAAPSNGTADGEAKLVAENVPGIISNSARGSVLADQRGTYYSISFESAADANETFSFRKLKSDFTGFDTSFGTAGKVTLTVPNVPAQYQGQGAVTINRVTSPSMTFFSGSSKVAMMATVSNCAPMPNMPNSYSCGTPSSKVFFSESTVGGAFSTPIDMTQKGMDFCTANGDSDITTMSGLSVQGLSSFSGFSRPVALITCSGYNNANNNYINYSQGFIATIAVDGTPTLITSLNEISLTESTIYRTSYSGNPNATGTEVAAVVLAVRAKGSNGSSGTMTNYTRSLIRIKADGTVVETPAAYSVSGSEPTVTLAPINDGTTVYALHSVSGINRLVQAPVASGVFNAGSVIALDVAANGAATSFSFPKNGVPNVDVTDSPDQGEKIAFVRTDNFMGARKIGPMSYRLSDGVTVTGELLSYSTSGSPLSYSDVSPNGNMYYIHTPAVTQATLSHKVIRWANVRSTVPSPVPTVTAPEVYASLNAGGGNIVINGVNLNVTSATKRVTGIRFTTGPSAGTTITTMTKTATSITVKVPSSSVAGIGTAPTPAQLGYTGISLLLGDGTTEVYAGDLIYVGATKLAQPLTMTVSTSAALTTDPDRDVPVQAGAFTQDPGLQEAAPATAPVVSSTTPTVCSIVNGKVRFLSNGTCTVKAAKTGNAWLSDGLATANIAVLKGDVVTVALAEGESPAEGASVEDAVVPAVKLASGRTDYTMTSTDDAKCSVNADTKAVWFKQGNAHCVITIATTGTVNGWAAISYNWDIIMDPPVGDSAAGAILVRNDNVSTSLPGLGVTWDQKNNKVYFTTRVRRVGPVQVKMTFTGLDSQEYTCLSNFGILKKTTLPAVGPLSITSGALCTDTKNIEGKAMTAAEKAAQTLAYNKFKELSNAIKTGTGDTNIPVKFQYRRELRSAATYLPVNGTGFGSWSSFRYAKLNYRAFDKITASLPTGVTAAVSETADGAFLPTIVLDSKRTDYSVTSADDDKCQVLSDGRIWAKVAGENCVLTIGTGTNTVWAGKSFTWTVPMVAAVGASTSSAVVAPSNGVPALAGPLALIWNQAKNTVSLNLTSRNIGLVTAKMTFTGLDNLPYTCEVKFGSNKKVASTLAFPFKVQSGPAFCTFTTGMTSAQKTAQAAVYTKLKALITARKSGVGMGVIPIEIAYKFEQYDAATGVILPGQILNTTVDKPWSATTHFKLNYRATTN